MVQHLPHPTAGSVPLLASPLRLVTSPAPARLPPPLLGQHTQEILGEWLGYDEAAVQTLRQEGVV
jgi:crotonobetainyl-CoA:carnitine CoA-transferase CaiB-like acyl-CoA transferase